jgi:hypothetical protein
MPEAPPVMNATLCDKLVAMTIMDGRSPRHQCHNPVA